MPNCKNSEAHHWLQWFHGWSTIWFHQCADFDISFLTCDKAKGHYILWSSECVRLCTATWVWSGFVAYIDLKTFGVQCLPLLEAICKTFMTHYWINMIWFLNIMIMFAWLHFVGNCIMDYNASRKWRILLVNWQKTRCVLYITLHSNVHITTSSKKYMLSKYVFTFGSHKHLLRTVPQILDKDIYISLVVIHKKNIREPHDLTT